MTNQKTLTRDILIQTLVDALEPFEYVYAFWEGGAAAFNRIDEWSDIDLYLVVDNEKVDEAFSITESALQKLSLIKQKYGVQHPESSGLFQAFYKLEDASEYLIIDLAILTLNSPEKFLEPEIHGKAAFYLNRSKIQPPPLDKTVFAKKLQERLEKLQARFDMFNNFAQKEINRGNYIEAIDLYHNLTLATLVEALRIKYDPTHYDFKTRYIHYELPAEIIDRLKHLYFVKDERDLQEKYHEATEWFSETRLEIDFK